MAPQDENAVVASPNIMDTGIGSLKRQMKQQAGSLSKLAKTSAGKGERIEAVVVKRLAPKPSSGTGSGKPPPTKLVIMVVSPTVSIPVVDKKKEGSDENYGPTVREITQGAVHWYSAFELGSNVVEGCRIVLVNPRGDIYNGRLSLAGGAELIQKASAQVLTSLDPVCYRLPTLANMEERKNVVIPVGVDKVKDEVVAYTLGYDDPTVYLNPDKNDPSQVRIGAYVSDSKGYPFTVQSKHDQSKVLVNVRWYDQHLLNFGISDLEVWSNLAPVLLEGFVGCILGYVDTKISRGMDVNHGANVEGSAANRYTYGLKVNTTSLEVDLKKTLEKVGFEVSADYVKDHFGGEQFLESAVGQDNVINKKRETAPVINLSEFTGKLGSYTDNVGTWKFYSLINPGNFDDIMDSQLDILRHQRNQEQRDRCMKAFHDSDSEAEIIPEYESDKEYIFAVRI